MTRIRTTLLAHAGILMMSLCALPAVSQAETLHAAMASALNHHPSIEAAIANRDAFAQERREEWADFYPRLNLRGSGGRGYSDNATSRGLTVTRDAAYSWLWEGGVTLTQPIFDGFETQNRVEAADLRRGSADYNIIDVRETVALRTVITYLDVLRGQETVAAVRAHERRLADYITRIQNMVDEGAADESMLGMARDIKAQLDNTMIDLQGQLRASLATYAEVVGREPDGALALPDAVAGAIPALEEEAIQIARQRHPSLQAAALQTAAQRRAADAEKQFYYPDINGELSYYRKDQAEEIGGEIEDARALIRLNWDISLAGGQAARARQARYRYAESRAQRAETERQIERDIRLAYNDLITARQQLNVLQERVSINEELFTTYEAQFEGALVNLLQLLQAENVLFNARMSMMIGRYRAMAAQYAVLASMGQLQDTMGIVMADSNHHKQTR